MAALPIIPPVTHFFGGAGAGHQLIVGNQAVWPIPAVGPVQVPGNIRNVALPAGPAMGNPVDNLRHIGPIFREQIRGALLAMYAAGGVVVGGPAVNRVAVAPAPVTLRHVIRFAQAASRQRIRQFFMLAFLNPRGRLGPNAWMPPPVGGRGGGVGCVQFSPHRSAGRGRFDPAGVHYAGRGRGRGWVAPPAWLHSYRANSYNALAYNAMHRYIWRYANTVVAAANPPLITKMRHVRTLRIRTGVLAWPVVCP